MKLAFVSASYADRAALAPALEAIKAALLAAGFRPHVFIEQYQFASQETREMMATALRDVRAASLLIAETTHKAIGVGIEVGAAAAWGIPIVAVRHADAAPSTTVGGLAAASIAYHGPDDLRATLAEALAALRNLPPRSA
ncbi:MAG: hypothetical protein AAGU78_07275 [Chloroflexota bacterium]|nr:hypothetical protein [Anaerolineae bacterium]HMM29035.1 hypothetical protein [Aggregatilineaceae bacterium]